ncbi:M-phase phosphoprotein 8 isoform X2 [Tachysurus fulvidraco]|uniref:M-phase phosphoprotein 8 isoform X2 n=1 Tax=Tachysurus fulvidraco TaxID=1234273 RepID=UPI001FEF05C7|nr:M-phase phosphoprotein 8 isoform X2 [Tachysurus fulvidraco]
MDSCAERADPGDSEQDEEEDVYEVERIIDMRVEDGEILYRVRWKNYSSDDDTWEPKAHLEDCSEVLLAYERSLAEKKLKKDPSMLPMKSELFDANSESDSDKDKLKESPSKKKKKKKKHAEDSEDEKSEKDKKKKKKKEKWKEDKPLPAPESDEEEERVPTLPPTKKDKSADSKKRTIEEDENDDAPAKKHKKEIKVKDGGKQKKEIVDERKKKKAKSKKEIESSGDETDKSDAPSELYTDDTSSTGNLSVTAKPTTAKTTDKSSRSESGSDHSKAKQKKNKSELKLQGFKDLVQDKNPKKTENSALLLRESGLNKLKSLTSSKSSSKSSRSEDEPDSSDAGATAKAKSKPKGLDSNSAPQKDLSVSSSSTVVAVPSKPREEEQLKEQKEETGEKGAAPNNLFEKFLLNCEAKDRVPRKQAAHTPKSSVKPDKKARKESPVQKTEFDKAKEGTIAMEVDERPEKSAQESEKSDRSNEPVAKMKEDVQREQKEEEQRRRKERLEEEEEKKRKEKLEESQRERKGKMEEAQKERQRLAEDVRLDWLDRRPAVEAMASTESTEDLRWKERRRKRREDSESRLLVTCDDTQDSQDPLERSDKTPDRGPPSLNLGVELNLDWMTLEDFQKHLNGEDENVSPLSLTPSCFVNTAELRDAVKNGNYMAVKRALSSKEDYNLDQQAVDLIFGPVEEDSDEADHAEEEEEVSEEENITEIDDFVPTDEEESSDEEEPTETGDIFQSKDGNILWSPIPQSNRRNIFGAAQERSPRGPTKYAITHAVSIKSTFELFISEEIQKIVLVMTNKEGCRVYGDSWRKLDKIDLQGYLGLLILAGVYKSSKEVTSSLWHAQTGRAIFCATMPLKTFNLISRVICFDDHNTRSARRAIDKLAAIRQVWDKWVCRLQRMYNPGTDVTVDKCLVTFKGRCGFKHYMANKPGSYGIKIWVVCDSQTSYAWNMQVYTGNPVDGQPEKNLGQYVILEVTKGLQEHIITCDHFFTSYVLGQELLKRKLAMVGTIRKNRPELPPALLATRDRDRLSSQFAFTDTHTLVSYCPKKGRNVLLMSTLHQDTKVSTTEDKKPQIILDYHKNKRGVDNLDKVTSVYSCKQMTAHWPITVFYNMLDVSAYNSFVLWREINPNWKQRKCHKMRLFLEELGRELVTPLIKRHQPPPRTPASASIVREVQKGASTSAHLPKRRRCIFCTNDTKTSTRCQKCDVHICKSHSIITCQSCK